MRTEESRQVVLEFMKAQGGGDGARMFELLDPEVEWVPPASVGLEVGKGPSAVLEAMACAVPQVVTDVGSVRDLVVDGETGRIVPEGDPQAFAAALLDVLGDADRRKAMGAAGRERVVEKFSLRGMIENYEAMIEEMARGR